MLAQAHPGVALLQEALAGGAVGEELRLEGLERDGTLLLVVEAEVDDAHAADERPAGDFVAVGDAGARGMELYGHRPCSSNNGYKLLGAAELWR